MRENEEVKLFLLIIKYKIIMAYGEAATTPHIFKLGELSPSYFRRLENDLGTP
jgi:hypothetical protein